MSIVVTNNASLSGKTPATDGRVLYGRREARRAELRDGRSNNRMTTALTIHFDGGRHGNGERYGSYEVKQGDEVIPNGPDVQKGMVATLNRGLWREPHNDKVSDPRRA